MRQEGREDLALDVRRQRDRLQHELAAVAPGRGVSFRPRFASATPDGRVGTIVGFAGEVFDRRGRRLPPGADVTAFIGRTRCAVATTRVIDNFTGFSIDVVGPESIPGCVSGGTITFEVDGRVANETARNEPGSRPHSTSRCDDLA